MSILNRFEQNKELLSNQELSIFQQIWQNLSSVQDKTLGQVVDFLHISRQSFLRVAKKLDYKDSSEFLLALNQQTVFENIEDTAKASHPQHYSIKIFIKLLIIWIKHRLKSLFNTLTRVNGYSFCLQGKPKITKVKF